MQIPASIFKMNIAETVFFDNPAALKNGAFQRIKMKTTVYAKVSMYSMKIKMFSKIDILE